MADAKLPTKPKDSRTNYGSSSAKTNPFTINSNPHNTTLTNQLTTHKKFSQSVNSECSQLGLEKTTYDETKENYNKSSEKKEESKEESKDHGFNKTGTEDVDKLVVNNGNPLRDGLFPTGIEKLDNYILSLIATNFLFPRVKFLDYKIDLQYCQRQNTVSHFVLGMLLMRKDVNLQTYWKKIKKYIGRCITRLRSEKTVAIRNAFHGKC